MRVNFFYLMGGGLAALLVVLVVLRTRVWREPVVSLTYMALDDVGAERFCFACARPLVVVPDTTSELRCECCERPPMACPCSPAAEGECRAAQPKQQYQKVSKFFPAVPVISQGPRRGGEGIGHPGNAAPPSATVIVRMLAHQRELVCEGMGHVSCVLCYGDENHDAPHGPAGVGHVQVNHDEMCVWRMAQEIDE